MATRNLSDLFRALVTLVRTERTEWENAIGWCRFAVAGCSSAAPGNYTPVALVRTEIAEWKRVIGWGLFAAAVAFPTRTVKKTVTETV